MATNARREGTPHMISISRRFLRKLSGARSGTISLIFGCSVFVIMVAAGMGVDGIRAFRVASRAASAIDSAALAAAKAMNEDDSLTDAQIIQIAQQVYVANMSSFVRQGASSATPSVTVDRANSRVAITSNLNVAMTLMRVIGVNAVQVPKTGSVTYAMKRVELAMVLDVTGSMNDPSSSGNPKITDSKLAAKDVVDILIKDGQPAVLAKIAIAPYSASLNVGTFAWSASNGRSADGCVIERLNATLRDTDESPLAAPFGVMGDLNTPTNGRYVCPSATVQPLTNDKAQLKAEIDAMTANGATAGHIGAAWGWNLISPNWGSVWPSAPASYSDNRYVKAVIVMTDGLFNTAYTAGTADADQVAESAARALAACSGMKAKGVHVFTVGVMPDATAEALLQSCATSAGDYFNVADGTALRTTFQGIASQLQNLRVTQ